MSHAADMADRRPQVVARIGATVAPYLEPITNTLDDALTACHASPSFIASIRPQMHQLLGRVVLRTFVLELHVARLRGELRGADGAARFGDFLQHLEQGRWPHLLTEYPFLAIRLREIAGNWVGATAQCLRRWTEDAPALYRAGLMGSASDTIDALSDGHGDPHRRMQTVRVVALRSGRRLVYKPRSLRSDVRWQAALRSLNDDGFDTPFPILEVVERPDHGWQPFIPHRSCADAGELSRFYRRQGGYLALLWALNATDIHYANVIAAGEHPYVVDVETLAQPAFPRTRRVPGSEFSVLDVALLPAGWRSAAGEWMDVSSLGARELSHDGSTSIVDGETDDMRLQPVGGRLGVIASAPTEDPRAVVAHVGDVLHGFSDVYDRIRRHRRRWLAPEGVMDFAADHPIRVIVRPTRVYMRLLDNLAHPQTLTSAERFAAALDELRVAGDDRSLDALVPSEQEDLRRGDIPYFSAQPDSLSLWDSDGREHAGLLAATGRERIRAAVAAMSDAHLARQRWLIEASVGTLEGPAVRDRYELPAPEAMVSRRALTRTIRAAAEAVASMAVTDRDGSWWYTIEPSADRRVVRSGGVGWYDGAAGIATFLAYCGRVLGDDRYTQHAARALSYVERALAAGVPLGGLGMSGAGGVLFALTHLTQVLQRASALDACHRIVQNAQPVTEPAGAYDLMAGTAGWIKALLAFHASCPSDGLLDRALRAGRDLVRVCQHEFDSATPRGLTGYAHGAAGVADALCSLHAVTGARELLLGAADCVRFEQRFFDAATRNWVTRRTVDPADDAMVAWCYGAPGIALSRLATRRAPIDADSDADLAHAVATTLRAGFGMNHSLCHGDLGNLDCLLTVARDRSDASLLLYVEQLCAVICAHIGRAGFVCGTRMRLALPTFGLMTGISGVGYALLRVASAGVPSMLAIEPPSAGAEARAGHCEMAVAVGVS